MTNSWNLRGHSEQGQIYCPRLIVTGWKHQPRWITAR